MEQVKVTRANVFQHKPVCRSFRHVALDDRVVSISLGPYKSVGASSAAKNVVAFSAVEIVTPRTASQGVRFVVSNDCGNRLDGVSIPNDPILEDDPVDP